ncbi:MAG: preQ(1) synthase [Sphaerospermopsis sp. SIO1G2]|nr:preQ(1) synthase [Sphaerospermopsis sp. SIO1G2]
MSDYTTTRSDDALPTASLGKRRDTPFTYAPDLLEAIPFKRQDGLTTKTWVTLGCLRFTSLCPVTGQPDWAEICINYLPHEHLIESKSLKEYLNSFRMHGDFHEDCCRIICNDISSLIKPKYFEVCGHFDSRGSIAIWPYCQYADQDDPSMVALAEQRFIQYRPGGYGPVATAMK